MPVDTIDASSEVGNTELDNAVQQWYNKQQERGEQILTLDTCLGIAHSLAEVGLDSDAIIRQLARENGETVPLPTSGTNSEQAKLVEEYITTPTPSFADTKAPLTDSERLSASQQQYTLGVAEIAERNGGKSEIVKNWLKRLTRR